MKWNAETMRLLPRLVQLLFVNERFIRPIVPVDLTHALALLSFSIGGYPSIPHLSMSTVFYDFAEEKGFGKAFEARDPPRLHAMDADGIRTRLLRRSNPSERLCNRESVLPCGLVFTT